MCRVRNQATKSPATRIAPTNTVDDVPLFAAVPRLAPFAVMNSVSLPVELRVKV